MKTTNHTYIDKKELAGTAPAASETVIKRAKESQKFISEIIWVGLGQFFMSMTGLVILPALTKNYPAQMYGIWSQMMVTTGLLRVFTLKFESATIRFLAAEEDKEKRRRAMGTMLWPILAVMGLGLIVSALLSDRLAALIFTDSRYTDFVILVFVWAAMDALLLFALSYLRARDKIKLYASIRLASSIARMGVVVSLSAAGVSFYWVIYGVIAAQMVFVTGIFMIIARELGFLKFSFEGLKTYAFYSIPMLPGIMLYWIINASDRYFITHMLDITQTGIYSASAALAGLLMLLSWPIGVVLFPVASRLWERGDSEKVKFYFEYSLKLFLMFAIPAASGIYILSQPLLTILATDEFAAGGILVLLLAAGVIFAGIYLINEYAIYLIKKTAWLPAITALGALINIGINIILIPRLGITGAAVSTIASYLVISIIIGIWGKKTIRYRMDTGFYAKIILSTVIMTAAIWYIKAEGAAGISLVILTGIVIYGLAVYLLKTFSKEEFEIIKNTLSISGRGQGRTN